MPVRGMGGAVSADKPLPVWARNRENGTGLNKAGARLATMEVAADWAPSVAR